MANIRQRGNSFQISVYLGEDQEGKKLFERTTFTPSSQSPSKAKKEAEAFARDFEDKVINGRYFQGDKIKFNDLIELWKKSQDYKNLSQSCKEDYIKTLNRRAVPALGNLLITKINPVHVQNIYDSMEKEGKAPTTIKRTHATINSVLKFAFRMELIDRNPCDRVKLPKVKKDDTLRYFNIEQSKAFINALSMSYEINHKAHTRTLKQTGEEYTVPDYTQTLTIPLQFQCYFTIAVYSGFRRSEMIALTWEDISFEDKTINVDKAIAKTEDGQIIKDTKTVAGKREIKLPGECFTLLREWKNEEKELCLQMGSKWEGFRGSEFDKNYVFIQTDINIGQHMDLDSPYKKFKEIIRLYNDTVSDPKDKLPDIRLHDLRHTSATLLLSQGVDIETVSHRMGHSKPSVTLDIYGHALESMDETASDVLESLLSAK